MPSPAAKPQSTSKVGGKGESPTRSREWKWLTGGASAVAGVDEVGRGALAGPVIAAAVILRKDRCPDGIDDSKRLLPDTRQSLFQEILDAAACVAVYTVSPQRIDRINILKASQEAMRGAIQALSLQPTIALVDGLLVPSFPCEHEPIVGGDGLECCIAAASIVAKVTRDNLMRTYAEHYPDYGFERHKGYATPAHRSTIRSIGLCPLHRRTFTRAFTAPQEELLL